MLHRSHAGGQGTKYIRKFTGLEPVQGQMVLFEAFTYGTTYGALLEFPEPWGVGSNRPPREWRRENPRLSDRGRV